MLSEVERDPEYVSDLATGRRVELDLSNDCKLTLQYFPEWGNICFSFYTKDMPGFTIGLSTEDWPRIQQVVADFAWGGRAQGEADADGSGRVQPSGRR